MDDSTIVSLYWDRNEDAIMQSEQKYGPFCLRVAANLLSTRQDAEECVNDTWHSAWNSMPPQRPSSLKAYLGRITRNHAISRFRANRAQKRDQGLEIMLSELSECIPDRETAESRLEYTELAETIGCWLQQLPKKDRILFVRRYWYGDSVKELAMQLGIAPSQAAQVLYRLRQKLKQELEQKGVAL